jgi:hypothetical protein
MEPPVTVNWNQGEKIPDEHRLARRRASIGTEEWGHEGHPIDR